jgi:hypothetical protein
MFKLTDTTEVVVNYRKEENGSRTYIITDKLGETLEQNLVLNTFPSLLILNEETKEIRVASVELGNSEVLIDVIQ